MTPEEKRLYGWISIHKPAKHGRELAEAAIDAAIAAERERGAKIAESFELPAGLGPDDWKKGLAAAIRKGER